MSGDVEMCRWLVQDIGLDPGLLNCNGHSALHKAALKGQKAVCEWLVDEAKLQYRHMQADKDGNTPARMAQYEGHLELSRWLQTASLRAATPTASATSDDCGNASL